MPDWLVWLIAAIVFAGVEAATTTLVVLMFGGGAAAAAITAALGGPVVLQVVVALVVTVALLGAVRPVAQRHLHLGGAVTGTDALVGRPAVVLAAVDANGGRVRLNGAEWSARTLDGEQVLPVGRAVRVVRIQGATAVVLDDTDDTPDTDAGNTDDTAEQAGGPAAPEKEIS